MFNDWVIRAFTQKSPGRNVNSNQDIEIAIINDEYDYMMRDGLGDDKLYSNKKNKVRKMLIEGICELPIDKH